jgi:hypothetical protein
MRFVTALSIGLAACSASLTGHAQADGNAGELLRRGVQLRREHRNEEALDLFERSYSAAPTPVARAQIALAEQALGLWLAAERDLDGALESAHDSWIDSHRRPLEEARQEVQRHLAWLTVVVDARDAEVELDGTPLVAGSEQRIARGARLLTVRANGYLPDTRRLEIGAGTHGRVEVTLALREAAALPAPAGPGIFAETPPRPAWNQEARSPGIIPAALGGLGVAGLAAGALFGTRRLAGDSGARTFVTLSTVAFTAGVSSLMAGAAWWTRDTRRTPGGTTLPGAYAGPSALALLGTASLAFGTYFGLHTLAQKQARDNGCTFNGCTGDAVTHDAEARSAALISTVAMGAGLVSIASGATWWVMDRGVGTASDNGTRRRSLGPAMLGTLGLVAVGAATYFGVRTYADKTARDAACSSAGCSPAGLTDDADARASATLATIGAGVGGTLLATGAAWWIADRSSSERGWRSSPWFGPHQGGLSLAAAF